MCGVTQGESKIWTNKNRQITIGCSDDCSGCVQDTFTKVFSGNAKIIAMDYTNYGIRKWGGTTSTISMSSNATIYSLNDGAIYGDDTLTVNRYNSSNDTFSTSTTTKNGYRCG